MRGGAGWLADRHGGKRVALAKVAKVGWIGMDVVL